MDNRQRKRTSDTRLFRVMGDALYCQQALRARVLAAGGDYFPFVKGNQPHLKEAGGAMRRFVTSLDPARCDAR